MLTGKQRGYLKKLAQTVQPAVIVGRAGVTDAVMQTIDEYLTANELLKVAIQRVQNWRPRRPPIRLRMS